MIVNPPFILSVPSLVPDNLWYPKSGATHLLAHEESSFTKKTPYTGYDSVTIGNDVALSIKHIDSATYNDFSLLFKSFFSKSIFTFSSYHKKSLSVSQFARDNNVFLEFHSNVCYVKKQETNEILLQENLKESFRVFDDFVPLS